MLHSAEKEQLVKAYGIKNQALRKKWKRILLRIGFFSILIIGLLEVIIEWTKIDGINIVFFVFLGIGILLSVIGLIVGKYMYSPRATYDVLLPGLVERINYHEEMNLSYQSANKDRKTINKESQLFSRGASVTVNSEISGYNQYLEKFSIVDIRVIISTGQSSAVLFDGFIFEIDRPNRVAFQLRDASRPSNKPVKFRKEEPLNGYKFFVEKEENIPLVGKKVVLKLKEIEDMFHVKHLYFSAMKEKTYLAIQSRDLPRKQRAINGLKVQKMYEDINTCLRMVNMLGDGQYDFSN